MRLLILLGPPGVGKGTVAVRMAAEFGFHWLSTGDQLREVQRSGSEFGRRVSRYMDAGSLVPDELIIELVQDEIVKLAPGTRLLLDGFPRTLPQATALDAHLAEHRDQVDVVLELQADEDELARRIRGRYQVDRRPDDTAETLAHRLEAFHRQTEPLTDYYRHQGKLRVIDAMGTPDQVYGRVRQCIDKYLTGST